MTTELKPFRIGSLTVRFPVILAPMAGVTDLPYRTLCRRLGCEYCVTEMMLDSMLLNARVRRRMLHQSPIEDHPLGGQLLGNDPASMAEAARLLCQLGFDVIDINFACPVHKALARRRGGFLMSQPQQTIEIFRAVRAAVADRPVTIKVRRSFREEDIEHSAFLEMADAAFECGIDAIAVHARSVQAKYTGKARWEFLAAVKQRYAGKTIIGSGDILTPAQALRMFSETGVDAVMVARGALGNPWFFRQVRDLAAGRPIYHPSLAEQRALLEGHYAHAEALYGKRVHKIMRGFGIKYARMHPTPSKLRMAFVAIKQPDDFRAVLEEFYRES